jgi:hypothetical protein
MSMGRFGQVASPLIAGTMLGLGWRADQIMLAMAAGGLIAAFFVVPFRLQVGERRPDIIAEPSAQPLNEIA